MKTVCAENQCTGCMACIDSCRFHAISIKDDLKSYNAVIDEDKCVHCNACHKVCQNNSPISFTKPISWKQGWSKTEEIRKNSSSGGLATALMQSFLANGGTVYSCAFQNGTFGFLKVSEENLNTIRGSKYVKSDPSGVYRSVKEDLINNNRVLFIGLPCQVAALKIFVGEKLLTDLYTVDLICHGTPSPKLLDKFLSQYKNNLQEIETISFRKKHTFHLQKNNKNFVCRGCMDRYSIAFLEGISYTENCYSCKFAQGERVSDITLGDSWGSELPIEEQRKGVSLILCQTEKGEELIQSCDLELHNVDMEKAKAANHQLVHPSLCSERREKFFRLLSKGKTFNKTTFRCLPKKCIKQKVKAVMIKLKIKKPQGGGGGN